MKRETPRSNGPLTRERELAAIRGQLRALAAWFRGMGWIAEAEYIASVLDSLATRPGSAV